MKARSIHIIVEGITDRVVLSEILDLSKYPKVYWIVAQSKNNIASYVRTLRLMIESETKILVVYDADTSDVTKVNESIEMMRQLSRSEYRKDNIRFYAFVPYLEKNLNMPESMQKDAQQYKRYAKDHKEELKHIEIIQKIQEYVDQEEKMCDK